MILLGDFNVRTEEVSEDFVELDNEHKEIPSRSNRDKIFNTNGRCLLDLCKKTEMRIIIGSNGSDKGIGKVTCITHNGKSLFDYFIIDSSSLNLIKDINYWNFDESLSDVHCRVVIKLAGSTETPPDDSVVVSILKKWNRGVQESTPRK